MKIQYFLFIFFLMKREFFFTHDDLFFLFKNIIRKKKKRFPFFYFCSVCGYLCLKTDQLRKNIKNKQKKIFGKNVKRPFCREFHALQDRHENKKQGKKQQQKKILVLSKLKNTYSFIFKNQF